MKEFKESGTIYQTVDGTPNNGDQVIVNNHPHVITFDDDCAAVSDEYDFTKVVAVDCDDPPEAIGQMS